MTSTQVLSALVVSLWSAAAFAHVTIAGPVFANKSQQITFEVGHGCAGADTYQIEVRIPEGVSAVRALPSAFGNGIVNKDEAGTVTSVVWTKSDDDVLPGDTQFYAFTLRARVGDTPFKSLSFPTIQTCRNAQGEDSVSEWVGGESEPAPSAVVLPARVAGWNKFVVADAIADLAVFADAQIVWVGDAAYSSNAAIAEIIAADDTVEALTSIAAGATVWVKY